MSDSREALFHYLVGEGRDSLPAWLTVALRALGDGVPVEDFDCDAFWSDERVTLSSDRALVEMALLLRTRHTET